MTAMAAVAMGVAFTSCSHNTDLYGGEEGGGKINGRTAKEQIELDKAVYKAAFEQSFGKVAPTVDWGFGPSTRAMTRTINSGWDGWISAPEDADFPADYPDGIISESEYYKYQNNVRKDYYLDDKSENRLNFWVGNADIWVKGTKKIVWTSPQDGMPVVSFHILPGANVTFTSDFNYQKAAGIAMYIDRTATVTFEGNLTSNVYLYNRGRVIVEGTTGPYGDGVFFNEGDFTSKGDVEIYNAGSQVINANRWTVKGNLSVYGSGHFRNLAGEMTVEGNTIVNSNDCSWINDATYTTENYNYTAGSHDVINNCKLFVNEDFTIITGEGDYLFQVDGGGSVQTKNFYGGGSKGGPFRVDLGSKAIFRVTNDCYLNATASAIATNKYGFCGVGTDYAVLDAKNVKNYGNPGHGYVAYGGNLYVSAESHFAQGTEGAADGSSYILFWGGCTEDNIYAPEFKSGKPAIKIPAKGCSIGFEGDDEQETSSYRVIAEDLSASQGSDFDFNDVVFDVDPDADGKGATITILAAGGIWPLEINGVEVHDKLIPGIGKTVKYTYDGVEYDCYPMINTGAGPSTDNKPTIRVTTGTWDTDENIRNSIKTAIVLKVFKYGDTAGTELIANEGEAACKILVDKNYKINSERNNIATGTKFKDYVAGKLIGRVWW